MGWVSGLWWLISSQPKEVDFVFDMVGLCIPRAPCSGFPVPGLGKACSKLT